MEAITRHLAEGLRRAVLLDCDAAGLAGGEDAAGVVVLAPDGSTALADEVGAAWVDELGANGPPNGAPARSAFSQWEQRVRLRGLALGL